MNMNVEKVVDQISKSPINKVLSQGFAELFQKKPEFPITYLAQWLKGYSQAQNRKKVLIDSKKQKQQRLNAIEKAKAEQIKKIQAAKKSSDDAAQNRVNQFSEKIKTHQHLGDLLREWLPEYVEKHNELTGAYVGKLDYLKKAIEEHNFEPGSENDTENPKIISYIGSSKSHEELMIDRVLPNEQGITYDVFQQKQEEQIIEEEQEQGQNPKPLPPKKKNYIYVPNVLKEPRLFYYRFPRLGAYACFSLRIKSCLNIESLEKGLANYRQYLKNKQEAENQHKEKLAEAKTQAEQAQKKLEDFQVPEDDPTAEEQKDAITQQCEQAENKVTQLENNPPVTEQVVFDVVSLDYFVGCDTLGQDTGISLEKLEEVEQKVETFKKQWEEKQRKMLLKDILAFLEDEPTLENLQNQLSEHERNISNNHESTIKQEQFQNRQKQGEFEYSLIKTEKLCSLLSDPGFRTSMEIYIDYSVPKFTEIIQIWCMLLGYSKQSINMPKSNTLNHRKMVTQQSFEKLFDELSKYELRRDSSEDCQPEYKINKLLERLQKIDIETLSHYNSFLLLLLTILKNYCWTRIYCRDARIETHEAKVKAKEQRDGQIGKWQEELQKNLQNAKAGLLEQEVQGFVEEDWLNGYYSENPKPLPLEVEQLEPHLDIE